MVEGKVARMTDFGAFVELEPGVDALLHVSQISQEHVDKPSDVLSVGQVITAKVVDFNGEDKKNQPEHESTAERRSCCRHNRGRRRVILHISKREC